MLADVVEHFRDPFLSFELIEKMLNKNGTVILQLLTWIAFTLNSKNKLSLDNSISSFLFLKKNSI